MKKFLFIIVLFFLVSCGQATETTNQNQATGSVVSTESFSETLKNSSEKITNTQEFNACMTPYVNACMQSVAIELSQKEKNASFCDELMTDVEKNSCRLGVVVSSLDSNADIASCDIITDTKVAVACKTAIIQHNAEKNNDTNQCNEITALYGDDAIWAAEAKSACVLKTLSMRQDLKKEDCSIIEDETNKKICEDMAMVITSYNAEIIENTSTGTVQ